MTVDNGTKKILLYPTWYEFKKDLEKESGCVLVNWWWLEVKPKAPLPWNDAHMKVALSSVSRFRLN